MDSNELDEESRAAEARDQQIGVLRQQFQAFVDADVPRGERTEHFTIDGAAFYSVTPGQWRELMALAPADIAGLNDEPANVPLTPGWAFAAKLGTIMAGQITAVDAWLDECCGQAYKEQPLAQDWARVTKDQEEKGEGIAELILATGQNPRKPYDPAARDRLLAELGDRAVTSVFAIQHFTKDARETLAVFLAAMAKAARRAADAGYES